MAASLAAHRERVAAHLGPDALTSVAWDSVMEVDRFRKDVLSGVDDDTAVSVAMVLAGTVMSGESRWRGNRVIDHLGRRPLPWQPDDVTLLFDFALRSDDHWIESALTLAVTAAERLEQPDRDGLADRVTAALEGLQRVWMPAHRRGALDTRLRQLIDRRPGPAPDLTRIVVDDGWSVPARARLMAETTHTGAIDALLAHANTATWGPRAPKAWQKRGAELMSALPQAADLVHDLLLALATCEPAPSRYYGENSSYPLRLSPENHVMVRGLVWLAYVLDRPWVVPVVAQIAALPFPGDRVVPNACFAVLGRQRDPAAVVALLRMQRETRDRGLLKQIASALDETAKAQGLSRSELAEQTVPDGGLDPDGVLRIPVADGTAVLTLDADGRVSVGWDDGQRVTARPPAHVKAELAPVRRQASELKKLVAGERDRLEDLLVEDRDWPLDQWRQRYLRHPVTRSVAGRLLWLLRDGDTEEAALPDGPDGFIRADGTRFEPGPDTRVRVWHPVRAGADEVSAWRDLLMSRELSQPFKQAFRDIYLLTPAEEQTGVYSNRFAAHVLRYPQAYALMKQRRWAPNFLGPYEGGYNGEARREFVPHGLHAAFYHEPADTGEREVTLCVTDQVRFERSADRTRQPVPLAEIPPVVFSEAMRDVDLFVGVCSIAADPTWVDRGTDRHYAYWEQTTFGELTASAQVRRDTVIRVLPKLKIRDRSRVEGNYLVVDGRKHTYRIHLGSGNILMSPNDQYLCIVPARTSAPASVRYLPFEGDVMLSVVLSKAMLLADDHRITDPTILAQIG